MGGLYVQAERLLLRSALEDPLNQRFVFLSEACAPLVPASVMYAQLMSEPKSRINACTSTDLDSNTDRCAPASTCAEKCWSLHIRGMKSWLSHLLCFDSVFCMSFLRELGPH